MSWLTFVLLALVLIFAIQGFRKGLLRMVISMVFFLMVLGVTSWLNPYISDFVREHTSWQSGIEEKCNQILLEQLEGREETFADYLGKYLSYTIINGICFLISFVIATILMYMILYAVDILTALPVIGTLNRIGGICIGCVQGILWV